MFFLLKKSCVYFIEKKLCLFYCIKKSCVYLNEKKNCAVYWPSHCIKLCSLRTLNILSNVKICSLDIWGGVAYHHHVYIWYLLDGAICSCHEYHRNSIYQGLKGGWIYSFQRVYHSIWGRLDCLNVYCHSLCVRPSIGWMAKKPLFLIVSDRIFFLASSFWLDYQL